MGVVYTKKHFKIYKESSKGYIVHNTHKPFSSGHTHINNYNTAKFIINLVLHSAIPEKRINNYLLESIIRISNDISYINNIQTLIR